MTQEETNAALRQCLQTSRQNSRSGRAFLKGQIESQSARHTQADPAHPPAGPLVRVSRGSALRGTSRAQGCRSVQSHSSRVVLLLAQAPGVQTLTAPLPFRPPGGSTLPLCTVPGASGPFVDSSQSLLRLLKTVLC